MKKISLFLFFALSFISNSSGQPTQIKYGFGYDANGNRIVRYIMPPRLANAIVDSTVEEYSQSERGIKITVYPNPTRGKLDVEVKNVTQNENAIITVFDTRGNLIIRKNFTGVKTTMDITYQPVGQYILRVTTDRTSKEWVISKTD